MISAKGKKNNKKTKGKKKKKKKKKKKPGKKFSFSELSTCFLKYVKLNNVNLLIPERMLTGSDHESKITERGAYFYLCNFLENNEMKDILILPPVF